MIGNASIALVRVEARRAPCAVAVTIARTRRATLTVARRAGQQPRAEAGDVGADERRRGGLRVDRGAAARRAPG